jgi:hypothetical protein
MQDVVWFGVKIGIYLLTYRSGSYHSCTINFCECSLCFGVWLNIVISVALLEIIYYIMKVSQQWLDLATQRNRMLTFCLALPISTWEED